ncbi:MAG: hypothetical protein EBR82_54160 [Caulobacteraceae bacterium]|nr:hypothetical protein [Caulobacteraceae bacterium]
MADDPFVGRTATNKQTGQRVMWMGGSKGWVPVDQNNLQLNKRYAPEVQTALEGTQDAYTKAQRLVGPAMEFQRLNREQGTGGLLDVPGEDGRSLSMLWPFGESANRLQSMNAITNRMVRSQVVPGTSGAMNTAPEQNMARMTFPTISNRGPANDAAVRDIKIERDVQLERMNALQKWASQGGTDISQFERMWAPLEAKRRQDLQGYYVNNAVPLQGGAKPAARKRIDINGNPVE